jgi:hypothetical protein
VGGYLGEGPAFPNFFACTKPTDACPGGFHEIAYNFQLVVSTAQTRAYSIAYST